MKKNNHKKDESGAFSKLGIFAAGVAAAVAVGGYFFFGPNGKKNRQKVESWVVKAKEEIWEKIEDTRDLTEEKYHAIVDQVTDKYSKVKTIGSLKAAQVAAELKTHWDKIQEEASKKEKNTEEKVKLARKKLTNKIDPDEK